MLERNAEKRSLFRQYETDRQDRQTGRRRAIRKMASFEWGLEKTDRLFSNLCKRIFFKFFSFS